MNNTTIKFRNPEHRAFFHCMIARTKDDRSHRVFFYLLGIAQETRAHVDQLFDFDGDGIRLASNAAWQTSGTIRICQLAANLWNGHTDGKGTTPYELFDCSYAPYFIEAIKLCYPEYF